MSSNKIPAELRSIIAPEQSDFIIKSKYNHSRAKGGGLLFFALLWNSFVGIFIYAFFGPLFTGDTVNFESNGTPTSASIENWKPLIMPGLIIGLFLVIGIIVFISAVVSFIQKGAFFVGTETRFIKYRKGKISITDWEQFSGNIKIKKNKNLTFELRTGRMQSKNKGPSKYVPNTITIVGIKNVLEIERKCRLRIKENDPTPVKSI